MAPLKIFVLENLIFVFVFLRKLRKGETGDLDLCLLGKVKLT